MEIRIRMNRARWILSGLIALLLALTAGLVLIVHAGQSMGHDQEERAGEFVSVPSPTPPPLTAREGYLTALPIAQDWADDAQLWQAQSTWSPGSDLQAPPPSWNYTFYSAHRGDMALVYVAPGNAKLLRTRPVSSSLDLTTLENWEIDSPEAFEILNESGGEAFLFIHPQRTLMLTLQADESLQWEATLIDEGPMGNAAGRQSFSLVFSAEDGRLITTPVQGDTNEQD